ncbi:hypothetical protein GEMRC1_009715 [Eukaryota sp. GEM-RC1]
MDRVLFAKDFRLLHRSNHSSLLSVNSFHPQWQLDPEPSIAVLDPPIPQDPPLDTSSELMFLWNSIESLSSIPKGLLIPKLKQLLSEQQ